VSAAQPTQKRVLIVEDNPDTADMLEASLLLEGYHAVKINHVGQAIHAILRENPDLVILDVMMPDVSGLELCRYMRRDPRFDKIKVLIASARTQPDDIAKGMEAGASGYLGKPFTQQELLETIERILAS
jgi:DNA-binding response OmpR family regulator